MKHACVYAIIKFRPFIETGEFANIGVVLMSTSFKYIDFQLLTRPKRVTSFFGELDKHVYRDAMAAFKEEMERFTDLVNNVAFDGIYRPLNTNIAEMYFSNLLKAREGLIRFDDSRLVLTDNPKEKLQELFEFYVKRNFVTVEYQQKLLENQVKDLLHREHLHFQPSKVGTADFLINFPFVKRNGAGQVLGIIKPLHVAQEDTTRILTTGGGWVDRIRRLKRHKALPDDVLFVLNSPPENAERRFNAYLEIKDDLIDLGVTVAPSTNANEVVNFAHNLIM